MAHMIFNQHYLDFLPSWGHGIRCQGGRSRPVVPQVPVQFHQVVVSLMVLAYFEVDVDVLYLGFSNKIMGFRKIL